LRVDRAGLRSERELARRAIATRQGKSKRFRLIAVQDAALKEKAKPVARAS
jgi:hypothetical protein